MIFSAYSQNYRDIIKNKSDTPENHFSAPLHCFIRFFRSSPITAQIRISPRANADSDKVGGATATKDEHTT